MTQVYYAQRCAVVRTDNGLFIGSPTGQGFSEACELAKLRSRLAPREQVNVYEILDAMPRWRRTYVNGSWQARAELNMRRVKRG